MEPFLIIMLFFISLNILFLIGALTYTLITKTIKEIPTESGVQRASVTPSVLSYQNSARRHSSHPQVILYQNLIRKSIASSHLKEKPKNKSFWNNFRCNTEMQKQ